MFVVVLAMLCGHQSFAQKSLKALLELSEPDKKGHYSKKWTERFGYIQATPAAHMKHLGQKFGKVGILSFMVSEGETVVNDWNFTSGTVTSSQMTFSGTKNAANLFYLLTIDKVIENFAEAGIELLTPDQYLTTDELKGEYLGFEMQEAKLGKLGKKLVSAASWGAMKYNREKVLAADGYKTHANLAISARAIPKKESLMALANFAFKAGLDGFIIPVINTSQSKIAAIEFNFYGINPLMKDYNPTRKQLKNWKPIHHLYTHYMGVNLPWRGKEGVYAEEIRKLVPIVGIVAAYRFKSFYL